MQSRYVFNAESSDEEQPPQPPSDDGGLPPQMLEVRPSNTMLPQTADVYVPPAQLMMREWSVVFGSGYLSSRDLNRLNLACRFFRYAHCGVLGTLLPRQTVCGTHSHHKHSGVLDIFHRAKAVCVPTQHKHCGGVLDTLSYRAESVCRVVMFHSVATAYNVSFGLSPTLMVYRTCLQKYPPANWCVL